MEARSNTRELSAVEIKENVKSNFLFIRSQLQLTQKAFGKLINLSPKTIGAIEEGRATSAINVYKLSKYTGISIDTLYTTLLNQ